jgi:flap endonuclease-1
LNGMGVKNWQNMVPWRWADVSELFIPKIAIDAPNYLMRRLSTIRLTSSNKIPMAHIHITIGLIRQALKRHILPALLFDGPPESLKRKPNPELITTAQMLYERFLIKQDIYDIKIVEALRESPALTMYFAVNHIKDLCRAAGIPAITSPTEAEMFGAVLCREGLVGSVVSNDADALLFGSPHVIKSLQLSKGSMECTTLSELERVLDLDLELLRDLAIVCGCDFHKKGIKGLGPRKGAIELKRYGGLRYLLKARGLNLSEREDYIKAREVFDEASFMSAKGVNLTLKPLITPKLVKVLQPSMGKDKAEAKTRELIQIWKMFGSTQTTLESFV